MVQVTAAGAAALQCQIPTALINIPLSTAKINEDNFGPEDDEIQFDDCGYGDDDDVDEVSSFDLSCLDPLMFERNEPQGRSAADGAFGSLCFWFLLLQI